MIASVISYCTNDYRFLKHCIEGVAPFSKQIIIVACSHFFSGIPENRELLNRSYAEHPECTFVEFAYDPDRLYGLNRGAVPETETWLHYWHSSSRYVGWHFVDPSIDYVLFADVDEICDGRKFQLWLNQKEYASYEALHFSSYFYFRQPCFRATTNSNSILMIKKDALSPELLLNPHERPGIFFHFPGKKRRSVRGLDNEPMVHHYSWVRTKEEVLVKVRSWGHRFDKNWESLVEEEFAQGFRGIENFHGFEYTTVHPEHDVLSVNADSLRKEEQYCHAAKSSFPNCTYVTAQDIFRLNIKLGFLLQD